MRANLPARIGALAAALALSLLTAYIIFAQGPGNGTTRAAAHNGATLLDIVAQAGESQASPSAQQPRDADAECTGGTAPDVEGTTLDLCYQRDFTVGGNARTLRVWYTTDTTSYTVDGDTYVHGITGEAQAADVADAAVEGWQAVFTNSAIGGHTPHEPYLTGCSNILNIQIRDGQGWGGIAYWGSSGSCNIGIDAPMINNGVGIGDDGVVFHEIQHYTQYSYDAGCYGAFQPLYDAGNAWIEGWANWAGKNATNAVGDLDYNVASYNSSTSYYDLNYTNLHAGYLIQQYGGNGAPGDPNYGVKAVYEHYRQCDLHDDIFVMDETIKALTGGAKTEKWAFVDFQAAYFAYDYADPVEQPELVFPDADDQPTSTPAFAQTANMSSGSQSWVESSPDSWTGKYYRIVPQSGCAFLELRVETQPPGGEIGINFMAVDTFPAKVQRSAHIGDNATRFFAGFPTYNPIVVNVTSFDNVMTYEVRATCVTPTLDILTPVHNPGHAMVGAPNAPIATLTRFRVTSSGGLAVSGVEASTITFDAEGDAPTIVPGSFQEVGPGEYWAAIVPPTKPAGTTFVDYEVCLNTTICDSESNALLYVDPGNVDTVYLFDESNSMNTEDTPGEGTRIQNAKRAGRVLPDLLRDGDRIGIIGFGALDNPAGCGATTGNCPHDNIVRLSRINNVSVPGDIAAAKTGVDAVSTRLVWTNIGQGLIDAKDMLLANPGNTNPDHIILLSDGEENVNPKYATPAVRGVLRTAGVCVSTIGLGPESPGALLAQIASENCGTYMPVATSRLGTSAAAQTTAAVADQLTAIGAPPELLSTITSVAAASFYPGQLGVANANEYLDTTAQDSSRLFHHLHLAVSPEQASTHFATIDKSVKEFQFLAAGKLEDAKGVRWVEILMPGMDPEGRWIPVSPPVGATPADWQVRNDPYQDVVIVKEPEPGVWGFRVHYAQAVADYIMNLSVQTSIRLEGNLLNLNSGQGAAGQTVPIVATLMDHKGLLPGATVVAAIANEGGTDLTLLLDDGNHNDGTAGDGIYGFPYSLTNHGGSYAVRILAVFPDPADPGTNLVREWNGGFWIDGPQDDGKFEGDSDGDGMPDDWERRCNLIVGQNDAQADPDNDGLANIVELQLGTSPCQADTDRGGERDGSEARSGRNPLWAGDDKAFRLRGIRLLPFNQQILVYWSQRPNTHVNVVLCLSNVAGSLGTCRDVGDDGDFQLTGLTNGKTYYITLYGEGAGDAQGAYTDQMPVTPAADPIPPQGAFFIDGPNVLEGGDVAQSRNVILRIDATDPDGEHEGPGAFDSGALFGPSGAQRASMFTASGDVEMRFANSSEGLASAPWEPLAETKPWMLDCQDGAVCTVFGQFRDGAGNESAVVTQSILLQLANQTPTNYFPSVFR